MTDDRARIEQAQRTADKAQAAVEKHEGLCDWRWAKLEERLDARDGRDDERESRQEARHAENIAAISEARGAWLVLVWIGTCIGAVLGALASWGPALVRAIRGL